MDMATITGGEEEEEGLLTVEALNTSPASIHTKPDWALLWWRRIGKSDKI